MSEKRVIIIASGPTEQGALPLLLKYLRNDGIRVQDVRMPPSNKDLDADMARRLILGAWYEKQHVEPPHKFVVLVDADGKDPTAVVASIGPQVKERVAQQVPVPVVTTAAKWHLEAWFFADSVGLRGYLGRDLGPIDVSSPDAIESPKHLLRNLLGRLKYSARIATEIAGQLSGERIRQKSPSFAALEAAMRNGASHSGNG